MKRKAMLLSALLLLLLIGALTFPLRLGLTMAGVDRAGFSARLAEGTIWSGRVTQARIGPLMLGDLDTRLSLLPLLSGRPALSFARSDERLGTLSGRLGGGSVRGISDIQGAATLSGGIGLIPLDQIRFDDVTVLFDASGQCKEARGRVNVSVAFAMDGLNLSNGLSGGVACVRGRAQASLTSQSGMEKFILSFDASGQYRARFVVGDGLDSALASALTAMGFQSGSDGLGLTVTGKF